MSACQVTDVLAEIESRCGVQILLAVEVGSRAWGYATPQSDHDVRFVYRYRNTKEYIRIVEAPRSLSCATAAVDAQGIDIHTFLRQLSQNRAIEKLQWLTNTVVYMEAPGFRSTVLQTLAPFQWSDVYVHQCLGVARSHWARVAQESVAAYKMYMYVLRALCAAVHAVEHEQNSDSFTTGIKQAALTYSPSPTDWFDHALPAHARVALLQLIGTRSEAAAAAAVVWSGPHITELRTWIEACVERLESWLLTRLDTNPVVQLATKDEESAEELGRLFKQYHKQASSGTQPPHAVENALRIVRRHDSSAAEAIQSLPSGDRGAKIAAWIVDEMKRVDNKIVKRDDIIGHRVDRNGVRASTLAWDALLQQIVLGTNQQ